MDISTALLYGVLVFSSSSEAPHGEIWINSNHADDHNLGVQFMNVNRKENERIVADYLAKQEEEDWGDMKPYYEFNVTMFAKERTGVVMFDTLSWTGLAQDEEEAEALAIMHYWHEYDADEPINDAVCLN